MYYIDPLTNQEEKVLDYDGAIGVYVSDDGWLSVSKNETYVGIGDEEEVYWGSDTIFLKKLW